MFFGLVPGTTTPQKFTLPPWNQFYPCYRWFWAELSYIFFCTKFFPIYAYFFLLETRALAPLTPRRPPSPLKNGSHLKIDIFDVSDDFEQEKKFFGTKKKLWYLENKIKIKIFWENVQNLPRRVRKRPKLPRRANETSRNCPAGLGTSRSCPRGLGCQVSRTCGR